MKQKVYALILMFFSAIFYTIASYFHLSFVKDEWTIYNALIVAMPIVYLEYNCSLRGIRMAHDEGISSNKIFLIIVCMCFFALYVLNKLILKDPMTKYDIIAFALVLIAFGISYELK